MNLYYSSVSVGMAAPFSNVLKSHPALCSVNNTFSTVGDKQSRSKVSMEESSISFRLFT